ncbi:MAG TPA: hypothetical protein VMW43_12805 [Bacteroidota bacterium]|nr:hypothetical protein [Bacteroidota bacterium]
MTAKIFSLLSVLVLALGMWSCKDVQPSGPNNGITTVKVTGAVNDLATNNPVQNATVYLLASGATDSMKTAADGLFNFEVNLTNGNAVTAVITVKKFGYQTYSVGISVVRDTAVNVLLKVDLSTSAIVAGTVRDSATLYPLRNSTALLSLPGLVDSMTTSTDGSFELIANLVDRDSLPVTMTIYHAGYKSRQLTLMTHKGQTLALGNVLMQVDAQSTIAQVTGRVFDHQSSIPLINASVQLTTSLRVDSVNSASDGSFSFSIDLAGLSSLPGSLKVSKSGYQSAYTQFTLSPGQPYAVSIYLDRDTTTGVRDSAATGSAHSIAFIGETSNEITVYGVGGSESTILTWEVRDSLGFPVDFDHRDTVNFQIVGTPVNGGAYVSPASAITNASGRVSTTVNSGTVAGVIQFIASLRRNSDGVIIQSTPVIITIDAGLPDQAHFTIGADQFNFPGYDWVNHTDGILVQVGDMYSNPVKQNTAVYFSTTGGVIDASGFTDVHSHASVTLYSGNPRPNDAVFGKGFAWVKAQTIGQNSVTVVDSELILFSGISIIDSLSTFSFNVPRGGSSGPISFVVEDENHNPLSPGTHITVTLQYTPPSGSDINMVTNGDVDVTLGDYLFRGPGTTHFTFFIVDQTVGGVGSKIPATVTITVTSANGNPPPVQIAGTIG